MRHVLQGLWKQAHRALARAASLLGGTSTPSGRRSRGGRPRREAPHDPETRGILASIRIHRERFDPGRSELLWEAWQPQNLPVRETHAAQELAVAALQRILERHGLWGRLEPLMPGSESALAPCVFVPSGPDRTTTWRDLRNLSRVTRWWPVEVDGLERLRTAPPEECPSQAIQDALSEAESLDLGNQARPGRGLDDAARGPRFLDDPEIDPIPGDFVLLVPTPRPWEVPAHLGFGGDEGFPRPAAHVAWLKHWHDLHGVEIRTMSPRALDLFVPCPPETREEAHALLREHRLYCPRTARASTTEERAAERLLKTPLWAFSWD